MNLNETEEYLMRIGIPDYLYSINSLGGGECMMITYNYEPNEGWAVAYSQRGGRISIKKFSNEAEACDFFIREVIEITKSQFDAFERQRTKD